MTTKPTDSDEIKLRPEMFIPNPEAWCSPQALDRIVKMQAQLADYETTLEFVMDKTTVDPAQEVELRCRAANVYQAARAALEKYKPKEMK